MLRRLIQTLLVAGALAGAGTAAAQECDKGSGGRVEGAAKSVHFDTGSVAIKPDDAAELKAFAGRVKGNPSAEVCLVGQTDKEGDAAANERLARRRAEAVRAFLQRHGLQDTPFQIVVRGEAFGEMLGDIFGASESDRRVEVWLIKH